MPHELARSLAAQRQWFADEPVRFVPLDFTFADHGQRVYEPADYGLDALWEAIEAAVPLGLREMVRNNIEVRKRLHDTYFDTAHPHILVYAGAAGGAGAIPLPYIDVPVVLAIQAKLFQTIGAIYGQPMNVQQMATIASGLGIGYLARFGVRELAKLIPLPGVGSAISGAFAAASTYGLGIALCEYFGHVLDGNVPDAKMFRGWYQEAFAAAKTEVSQPPSSRLVRPSTGKGTSPMTLAHQGRLVVCSGRPLLIAAPYLIVFGVGSVWMWRHGLIWSGPWARACPRCSGWRWWNGRGGSSFPGPTSCRIRPPPRPPPARRRCRPCGDFAAMAGQDPPLDQPDVLEKVVARRAGGSAGDAWPGNIIPRPIGRCCRRPWRISRRWSSWSPAIFARRSPRTCPGATRVTPGRLLWWKAEGRTGLADRHVSVAGQSRAAAVHAAGHGAGAGGAGPLGPKHGHEIARRPEAVGDRLLRHQGRRLRHPTL